MCLYGWMAGLYRLKIISQRQRLRMDEKNEPVITSGMISDGV